MGLTGGEPAASWFCPACGHVWISAVKPAMATTTWTCSCGYATARARRERESAKRRASRALRKARAA